MTDTPATLASPAALADESRRWGVAYLVLAVAVLVTFGRVAGDDFTWWDDPQTLHQNPLMNPPTWGTAGYYLTHDQAGLYHPVTSLAWAALAKVAYLQTPTDEGIYLNPWVFHIASVLVHLCAALAAAALLRRLLPGAARAAVIIGAGLFALHPVQVESVAWASGLKDVLAGALGIAALLLHVRGADAAARAEGMGASAAAAKSAAAMRGSRVEGAGGGRSGGATGEGATGTLATGELVTGELATGELARGNKPTGLRQTVSLGSMAGVGAEGARSGAGAGRRRRSNKADRSLASNQGDAGLSGTGGSGSINASPLGSKLPSIVSSASISTSAEWSAVTWHALALLVFVLAMLAKPSAVMAGPMALVLDRLLLGRTWRRSLLTLLPWALTGAVVMGVAAGAQTITMRHNPPMIERPLLAGYAMMFYIGKLLWPAVLNIDYGRRAPLVLASGLGWVGCGLVGVLSGCGWVFRRRYPAAVAGAAVFALGPFLVLGWVTFQFEYYSLVADHYLSLAMVGPGLALAWAVGRHPALAVPAAVVVLVLAGRSFVACGVWQDERTLFTHVVRENPMSFLGRNNLGVVLDHDDNLPAAMHQWERALAIEPGYPLTYRSLGVGYARLGQIEKSRSTWNNLIDLLEHQTDRTPGDIAGECLLAAQVLADTKAPGAAGEFLARARRLAPGDPQLREREAAVQRRIEAK